MSTFFIVLLTFFLLGICGFTILLILMQRPSEESGMGATLGGGAVTSVFGGEAVNTLAKMTRFCVIIFFVLSFILALFHMSLEETIKSRDLLEKKVVPVAETSKAEEEFVIPEEQAEEVKPLGSLDGEISSPAKKEMISENPDQQKNSPISMNEEGSDRVEDIVAVDKEI